MKYFYWGVEMGDLLTYSRPAGQVSNKYSNCELNKTEWKFFTHLAD